MELLKKLKINKIGMRELFNGFILAQLKCLTNVQCVGSNRGLKPKRKNHKT